MGLKFHELRHTAGTLAAQTGATTKELMARLGHSSPRAALIYQHASEKRDRRIADRLSEMVAEEGVPSSCPMQVGHAWGTTTLKVGPTRTLEHEASSRGPRNDSVS
jgi:hypothetical protein